MSAQLSSGEPEFASASIWSHLKGIWKNPVPASAPVLRAGASAAKGNRTRPHTSSRPWKQARPLLLQRFPRGSEKALARETWALGPVPKKARKSFPQSPLCEWKEWPDSEASGEHAA